MKIEFNKAKKRLAILWFVACGLIFILMFLQTMTGKYENKINDAWGWLFPSILPTLSLIMAVFLYDINSQNKKTLSVDRFYFRLTFTLSLFYLTIIISLLLLQPIINRPIISLMKDSNIYLGPLQGILSGAMGLFFIKKE